MGFLFFGMILFLILRDLWIEMRSLIFSTLQVLLLAVSCPYFWHLKYLKGVEDISFYLSMAVSNFHFLGDNRYVKCQNLCVFVYLHHHFLWLSFCSPWPLAFLKLFISSGVAQDNTLFQISSFKMLSFSCR